jgi:hypothetical protein
MVIDQTGQQSQTGRGKSDWRESQTGEKVRLARKSDWRESQTGEKVRLEIKSD